MDRAKEAIEKSFNGREERYKEIFEIIDRRWDCQLHRPLHAACYFLNPEFFYDNRSEIEQDKEVMAGLYKCIQRLVSNINQKDKILEELTSYKREEGLFGLEMAKRQRKKKAPGICFVRALALRNANAIYKGNLAFQASKPSASGNCKPR